FNIFRQRFNAKSRMQMNERTMLTEMMKRLFGTAKRQGRLRITVDGPVVKRDGEPLLLHPKAQQVLQGLLEAAPRTVSREQLINHAWQGNYLTGDKGLRQAIWSIRSALGESAREPGFVSTVPRQGYRWTGPLASTPPPARAHQAVRLQGLPALLVAAVAMISLATSDTAPSLVAPAQAEMKIARVQVSGSAVIVDMDSGCRAILKSGHGVLASSPIVSGDGAAVAIPVMRDERCEMVLYRPGDEGVTRFDGCPAVGKPLSDTPIFENKTI
ncbi:MAG: winged helix-turn-helix domain-containing protein, partial [Gammaproteobacteria bacterium]|nr:winged helix-turn-helix domain-containing protein [Gammaproteobacteria bacterium]